LIADEETSLQVESEKFVTSTNDRHMHLLKDAGQMFGFTTLIIGLISLIAGYMIGRK
jgi:hypothetical protein